MVKSINLNNDYKISVFNNKHMNNNLNGYYMYKLYSDYCIHCKNMEAEWNKFINNNSFNNLNIIEIEHNNLSKINKKFNVPGYPSIVLFNNDKLLENFNDERLSKNFDKFLTKNMNKENLTGGNLVGEMNKLIVPASLYAAKSLIKNKKLVKNVKDIGNVVEQSMSHFINQSRKTLGLTKKRNGFSNLKLLSNEMSKSFKKAMSGNSINNISKSLSQSYNKGIKKPIKSLKKNGLKKIKKSLSTSFKKGVSKPFKSLKKKYKYNC